MTFRDGLHQCIINLALAATTSMLRSAKGQIELEPDRYNKREPAITRPTQRLAYTYRQREYNVKNSA